MFRMLKQVRAASSLLNPEEIRKRAGRGVHVGLVASSDSAYEEIERFVLPASMPRSERLQGLARLHRAGDPDARHQVDFVVYEYGVPPADGSFMFRRDNPDGLVDAVLREYPDLALPLARQFPSFRDHVVDDLIKEVARENAMFSVATALPNVLPSVMEIPWVLGEFASDTVFLSANQVRLATMIRAACGEEIGLASQKAEIAAIAGGAFGWRALARQLAGKIPLGGGLIPKGAIAYAGTILVGKSLAYFHRTRTHYTPEQREAIYRGAYEEGRAVAATPPSPVR